MPFDFTPTQLEPWQQLLLDGAQRVRRGWCQNRLQDDHGGVCVVWALNVIGSGKAVFEASEALSSHVGGNIVVFNNTPGRKAEEVASAMEAAAMEPANV